MEGFRNVPGLRFSPSELMALTFSRRLITPLEGTELHTSLQSALGKAAAALPLWTNTEAPLEVMRAALDRVR